MKLIGIVGSAAEVSTNRQLLNFIKKQYKKEFTLELVEIKDFPLFNQEEDQTQRPAIQRLNRQLLMADGVIIATPEQQPYRDGRTEKLARMAFIQDPSSGKQTSNGSWGASYYDQGTSRAQLHLRQILDAPGVNALVMPGNEFLLGKAKEAFDEAGDLIDARTVAFLDATINSFLQFIKVVSALAGPKQLPPEDLYATGENRNHRGRSGYV